MPLQNRVTPTGEIIASPSRGTMMGNRGGCFHTAAKQLKKRPYASTQWICCVLEFKNRRRSVMTPGLYTELFFLDEATALAAGHRPCFECRRDDAMRFARIWSDRLGHINRTQAPEMDRTLHPERMSADHRKVTYRTALSDLPSGTFIRHENHAYLKWRDYFYLWSPNGYAVATIAPSVGIVEVLTPRSIVAQFAAGYTPSVYPSIPN